MHHSLGYAYRYMHVNAGEKGTREEDFGASSIFKVYVHNFSLNMRVEMAWTEMIH